MLKLLAPICQLKTQRLLLLDPGKDCVDKQWASAISSSGYRPIDLQYLVNKLRRITTQGAPLARQAAIKNSMNLVIPGQT
jgi:hypothetical protein